MPAYMNGKTGSWYVQCYYSDIDGNRKHKVKRGFATRDEALTWEAWPPPTGRCRCPLRRS